MKCSRMVHSVGPTSVVSYRRIGTMAFESVVPARTSPGDPSAWTVSAISVSMSLIGSALLFLAPGVESSSILPSWSRRLNWS